MPKNMEIDNGDETIRIDFEARRVIIHERYENLHILNDLLLAVWFLVGSVMFFYKHWTYWGTWLFVLGSAQMAIGPLIRVSHKLHLRRFERLFAKLNHSEEKEVHSTDTKTTATSATSATERQDGLW